MIKTYATEIERGKKYFYRPGVYVILPFGSQVLLTFQADPHNEFQLPGGGIDAGEQPIPALYREVIEETGWVIGRPRKIGAFRRFVYMPEYKMRAEKLCHIRIVCFLIVTKWVYKSLKKFKHKSSDSFKKCQR